MIEAITNEISKEKYNKLQRMSYDEQEAELFPDGIPESWAMGYGYYGHSVFENNGKYYVQYKIGSSCD